VRTGTTAATTVDHENDSICVIIATYRRPHTLSICLSSLSKLSRISKVIVVDDSTGSALEQNREAIRSFQENTSSLRLAHIVTGKRNGSCAARNIGLNEAGPSNCTVLLLDDDMELVSTDFMYRVKRFFEHYPKVGIVSPRIIQKTETSVNKPFYLNHFLADYLSRLTGFVFLDLRDGPRIAQFVPPAMFLRKELADVIRYDPEFIGNGYREESDLQQRCKSMEWTILYDPTLIVNHWGQETGGNREMSKAMQMYWRSRNHVYYLRKNFSGFRLFAYLLLGLLILCGYSLFDLHWIRIGLRDGFRVNSRHRQ
jgi:GT2 family glycosyltransferase